MSKAGTEGGAAGTLLAQAVSPGAIISGPRTTGATILPTDVLPKSLLENPLTFAEDLQLRILKKLPSAFYFNASVESSFRLETNPFQDPVKRVLLQKLVAPGEFPLLSAPQQQQILSTLRKTDSFDNVFRVLPSITGGFTLTPRTRVFGNFFMIRDSLFKNITLNTNVYSYAYGIQHDIPLGERGNLQAEVQFRELNQMHQHSVFDFLPGLTASYILTPRTVAFASSILQIRGRKYFQAPTREIDPFYTWGLMHQRGRWTFSANSTFVQNFRNQFGHQALLPVNNYSMISDFEVARRIMPQLPGLQAFMRAEPIWNMHSHNHPGLAGMDFRLYYGLRFSVTKPSLTAGLRQLEQQIEEQEKEETAPQTTPSKPSAMIMPYELQASQPQPIHGFLCLEQQRGAVPRVIELASCQDLSPSE
ncbi:MAG TPA: hypothetical protein V6D22_21660 [Candidatus Obscuribacterales bacterium]